MATIVRWEPLRELSTLFHTLPAQSAAPLRRWLPAMDLVESGDHYVLSADLPGLTEADVEIEVSDRVLTVSGERTSTQETTERGYRRVERAFGSFKRSVTLPEGVDAQAVTATFANGVLEVSIPKPVHAQPHKIAIGAGAPPAIEADAS